MNALLRPVVVALALASLAACLLGLRFACGLAGLGELMREIRHAEELEWRQRATCRRMESRRQVVQEVIAGRCGLGEALAWFRGLEGACPEYATVVVKVRARQGPDEEAGHVGAQAPTVSATRSLTTRVEPPGGMLTP